MRLNISNDFYQILCLCDKDMGQKRGGLLSEAFNSDIGLIDVHFSVPFDEPAT
jgi:hypothetical protein